MVVVHLDSGSYNAASDSNLAKSLVRATPGVDPYYHFSYSGRCQVGVHMLWLVSNVLKIAGQARRLWSVSTAVPATLPLMLTRPNRLFALLRGLTFNANCPADKSGKLIFLAV